MLAPLLGLLLNNDKDWAYKISSGCFSSHHFIILVSPLGPRPNSL